MFLDTTDGVAILGYAGLGATAKGTEPSEWMSRVLRGRNMTMEQSLGAISDAMQANLPRHMRFISPGELVSHHVVAPAFVGGERRVYLVELALHADRKGYSFRYTRFVPPKIVVAGSGLKHLPAGEAWARDLMRLTKAHDRGKISPRTVASQLAALNYRVHLSDASVSPDCIVAWRARHGGGAHQFYSGEQPVRDDDRIPSISRGVDMSAFLDAIMPETMKQLLGVMGRGPPHEIDGEAMNVALAALPSKPDESLE